MKKAVVCAAVALAALIAAPGASARATYFTDVYIGDVQPFKNGESLVSGALFSEKKKCRGNREVKLYDYVGPAKRRGEQGDLLDTATTSGNGGYGLVAPPKSIGYAVLVKAPKDTKGDDTCGKDTDVYFLF
jgi:hypothetical protein